MELKKLLPWNWFKHEDSQSRETVPVQRRSQQPAAVDPIFDNLPLAETHPFAQFLRLASWPFGINNQLTAMLQPRLDVAVDDEGYHIQVELPGLKREDVTLELRGDSLIIRGEKSWSERQQSRHYYRVERSYGQFQRVLALPQDADHERIEARMKDGVLSITIGRRATTGNQGRTIAIN